MKVMYIYLDLKDVVYEPLSPFRHATELYSLLITRLGTKPIIFFTYTILYKKV